MNTFTGLAIEFVDKIKGYNNEMRGFLIEKFESMMATNNPFLMGNGVPHYAIKTIDDVVEVNDKGVLFKGFNKQFDKEEVLVSAVDDTIYETTYNIITKGNGIGTFSTSITRLPMDYSGSKFIKLRRTLIIAPVSGIVNKW